MVLVLGRMSRLIVNKSIFIVKVCLPSYKSAISPANLWPTVAGDCFNLQVAFLCLLDLTSAFYVSPV